MEEMDVQQRIEEDSRAFLAEYPDVNVNEVPDSVWEAVRKGESLVRAYGRHERAQLKEENQRLKEEANQNAANRERSLGSVRSAGKARVRDDFLMGFDMG